jgi:hypothetical protein
LTLIGIVATGCRGEAAPAAPSIEGTNSAQEPAIGAIRTSDASTMVDLDPSTSEIDTETLDPGQEFLVLDVTITNIGAAPHEFNPLSWSAQDPASGTTYQAAFLAVTGYDLIAGDLEPEEATGGDVVIAIPEDASQLRVSYDTQLFNQGTELSWDIAMP